MPLNFSDFIVHDKADHDLLSIPVDEQRGTFSIQVQDGSLESRILRWLKGERTQTNINQLRAAEELFHSVLMATDHDTHRTDLIFKSAGIKTAKSITVRQIKKVIVGLGLTKQDTVLRVRLWLPRARMVMWHIAFGVGPHPRMKKSPNS
jgi:hypothetical protein